MNSDNKNYEVIFCREEGDFREYCENCDKLCFERHYKNHLKLGTHTNNFHKRQ